MLNAHHPFFDTKRIDVLAHRGSTEPAAANTINAFRDALLRGATHVETDARASRDGIAVLVHDPQVHFSEATITINKTDAANLARLDLGAGQGIPTLFDALQAFPQALFNIDVKSRDAVKAVAEAIIESGAENRVLVTSFSSSRRRSTLRQIRKIARQRYLNSGSTRMNAPKPQVATSASGREVLIALIATKCGFGHWVFAHLSKHIQAFQVPERVLGTQLLTPLFVTLAHAHDMAVHVWTINMPQDFARLMELGVDGFTTDDVTTAVKCIGSTHKPDNRL